MVVEGHNSDNSNNELVYDGGDGLTGGVNRLVHGALDTAGETVKTGVKDVTNIVNDVTKPLPDVHNIVKPLTNDVNDATGKLLYAGLGAGQDVALAITGIINKLLGTHHADYYYN